MRRITKWRLVLMVLGLISLPTFLTPIGLLPLPAVLWLGLVPAASSTFLLYLTINLLISIPLGYFIPGVLMYIRKQIHA